MPLHTVLKKLIRPFYRRVADEVVAHIGFSHHRARRKQDLARRPSMGESIRILESEGSDSPRVPNLPVGSCHAPVFILAAGWRSGSTLLQRLCMSRDEIMIWGEPYSREGLLESLGTPLLALGPGRSPDHRFVDKSIRPSEYSTKWIPTVAPPTEDLRAAYAVFLDRVFGSPAREMGASRWGLKDVRLGCDTAHFLRWVYPAARIVFLVRNPYDAWASFRGSYFYHRWPAQPVFSPTQFGRHWRRLVGPMMAEAERVGARLIRYEDLVSQPAIIDELEDFLSLTMERSLLSVKVGSSRRDKSVIPAADWRILRPEVDELASRLGYSPP